MSDITITNGLPADSPWTLANTDTSKLDQTNLINLAVGQLALLGASQGQTLQVQTGKLKELIGSVNTVNAQLDLLSTPQAWAGTITSLGFPESGIGIEITPDLLNNKTLLTQMVDATKKMESLGVLPRATDGYYYTASLPTGLGGTYSAEMISKRVLLAQTSTNGLPDYLTANEVKLFSPYNLVDFNSGQIINVRNNNNENSEYIFIGIAFIKMSSSTPSTSPVTRGPLAHIRVPSSNAELFSWELQASNVISQPFNPTGLSSAKLAIQNTMTLTDVTKILAPNTLPVSNPPSVNDPTNAVTMKIDNVTGYDMAAYTVDSTFGMERIYAAYPPIKLSQLLDSSVLTSENVGKVLEFSSGDVIMVRKDLNGNFESNKILKSEPFFYKPTPDQIISWKSQYAEKIIIITQRSSDQQLFVTNLAQKYQYSFDAATYVLKAFTTMLNSVGNNI